MVFWKASAQRALPTRSKLGLALLLLAPRRARAQDAVTGYSLLVADTTDGQGEGCYDAERDEYNQLEFEIWTFDGCPDTTLPCPSLCASPGTCGQFASTTGYVGFQYEPSFDGMYCRCLFESSVTNDPLNDSNVCWINNGMGAEGPVVSEGFMGIGQYCYNVAVATPSPTSSPTPQPPPSIPLDDYLYAGPGECLYDGVSSWSTIEVNDGASWPGTTDGQCAASCEAFTPTKLGYRGFERFEDGMAPVAHYCTCLFDANVDVASLVLAVAPGSPPHSTSTGSAIGPVQGIVNGGSFTCYSYSNTATYEPTSSPTAAPTSAAAPAPSYTKLDDDGRCTQGGASNYYLYFGMASTSADDCATKCHSANAVINPLVNFPTPTGDFHEDYRGFNFRTDGMGSTQCECNFDFDMDRSVFNQAAAGLGLSTPPSGVLNGAAATGWPDGGASDLIYECYSVEPQATPEPTQQPTIGPTTAPTTQPTIGPTTAPTTAPTSAAAPGPSYTKLDDDGRCTQGGAGNYYLYFGLASTSADHCASMCHSANAVINPLVNSPTPTGDFHEDYRGFNFRTDTVASWQCECNFDFDMDRSVFNQAAAGIGASPPPSGVLNGAAATGWPDGGADDPIWECYSVEPQATPEPTQQPTISPTTAPTTAPTSVPSRAPTGSPVTTQPTNSPTAAPTKARPSEPESADTLSGGDTSSGGLVSSGGLTSPVTPESEPATSPTPPTSKSLWIPDWTGSRLGCTSVDEDTIPFWTMEGRYTYSTLKECCSVWFSYDLSSCDPDEAALVGPLYFPDWHGANKRCISTHEYTAPEYMAWAGYTYATIEECCSNWYSYDYALCAGVSVPIINDRNWYVNWQKYICVRNCPVGSLDENGNVDPLCGGTSLRWEWAFEMLDVCCETMLGHQDTQTCVRDSLHRDSQHYTGRYYVNNRNQHCGRDCEIGTDPTCIGHPYDVTVITYDTPQECCKNRLWWLDLTECVVATGEPEDHGSIVIPKAESTDYTEYHAGWFRSEPNRYDEPWFRERDDDGNYDQSWYNNYDREWKSQWWDGTRAENGP